MSIIEFILIRKKLQSINCFFENPIKCLKSIITNTVNNLSDSFKLRYISDTNCR